MLITSFNAGQLSEKLYGRVDLQPYYQAASKLSNFDIITTGGISRRSGFMRTGKLTGKCRLVPFIVSKNLSFLLEIGSGYIKVWKDGKPLTGDGGLQAGFTSDTAGFTLYQSLAEIHAIQYAQNYDTLILTHQNYPPVIFRYIGQSSFTIEKMTFTFTPELVLNDQYDYYTEDKQKEDAEKPNTDTFQTAGNFPAACAFFQNRLFFAGTLNEPQKIWASAAPDTSGNRYTDFATYKKYVTVQKVIKDCDLHVFTADATAGNGTLTNSTQDLTHDLAQPCTDYYVNGYGVELGTKVTGLNATSVSVTPAPTQTGSRKVFTMQLWKDADNATAEDYTFQVEKNNVTASSCSFNFEIASDQNDAIKWLSGSSNLICGTESSEWIIPAGVSATNLAAQLISRNGTDDIQATTVSSAVIYFGQGKRSIRQMLPGNGYQSADIATLCGELISESEIIDFDFVNNPQNRLLLTRADGKLALCLYEPNQGITAWSSYTLGGKRRALSCATVRGADESDVIYCAVEDDTGVYLERGSFTGKVFLDSYEVYTEKAQKEAYTADAVVCNATSGVTVPIHEELPLDFATSGDTVYIGYEYESVMRSMPVMDQNPTAKKRIVSIMPRFYNSYLPEFSADTITQKEKITGLTEPYSGVVKVPFPSISNRDVFFTVSTKRAFPCVILSLNAEVC